MYSEAELQLTAPRDWTHQGVTKLSLWFRGYPASTGSFVEGPVGTYTMTATGADIWTAADEFHFASGCRLEICGRIYNSGKRMPLPGSNGCQH